MSSEQSSVVVRQKSCKLVPAFCSRGQSNILALFLAHRVQYSELKPPQF